MDMDLTRWAGALRRTDSGDTDLATMNYHLDVATTPTDQIPILIASALEGSHPKMFHVARFQTLVAARARRPASIATPQEQQTLRVQPQRVV